MSVVDVIEKILQETQAGRAVALCTVVATRGSTPQSAGTMICVDQAANLTGTIGGGCVEADIRRQAHQLLGLPPGKLISFALDSDFGADDGMICGGRMDVAVMVVAPSGDRTCLEDALTQLRTGRQAVLPIRVEADGALVEYRVTVEAQPKLVIAGAGHISGVLARLMVPLGFHVSVIDDRVEYANAKRFPPPMEPVAGDIAKTLEGWPIDGQTYIVIVTRGHNHDEVALKAVVAALAKYIGMIGSRRKIKVIFDDLRGAGVTEAQLERVHAPIGLDIRAVTVEEIAVSIAAELVKVRRVERHRLVEGPIHVS